MKSLYFAIAAVSAAIAFSSCENLNDEYISASEEIVINASISEQPVDTKTAIDEFGSKVKFTWLSGDAISVFFGDSDGSVFVTDETAAKAKFKGTIGAVMGGGDDLTDETSLWGVYPYDRNTTCDGSSVTLTLPYEQGAASDTFADDLFPSIARSTNFTLAFYPVCGSIRFKVSNPDIVKVTLSGNNNEDLAGKATVSMLLGGVPEVQEISEGQKELVMHAPDGGCFDTDKYYYFVFYPSDFSKGYTLTYYKSDSKATYVKDTAYPVKRNQFGGATNKDSGLTFTKTGYDYIDENGINQGQGVEIDGVVWAPVNCGYHKTDYPYGKLYQWGRKYGQGYDENDKTVPTLMNIDDSLLTMTESQSEDYENVFFFSTSGGWSSPWANTVWNSGTEDAPIKTDYDPCPKGWRVPTKNELDCLDSTNNWTAQNNGLTECYYQGYQYEHAPCVGFSAGGFRDGFTGEAQNRNVQGAYWSSSSIGTSGNAFCKNLVGDKLTFSTAHLHGLSVRCVQE